MSESTGKQTTASRKGLAPGGYVPTPSDTTETDEVDEDAPEYGELQVTLQRSRHEMDQALVP